MLGISAGTVEKGTGADENMSVVEDTYIFVLSVETVETGTGADA